MKINGVFAIACFLLLASCQPSVDEKSRADEAAFKIAQLEAKLTMAKWESQYQGAIKFSPTPLRGGVLLFSEESDSSKVLDTLPMGIPLVLRLPDEFPGAGTGSRTKFWEAFTADGLHGFVHDIDLAFFVMDLEEQKQLLIGMDHANPDRQNVKLVTHQRNQLEPISTYQFISNIAIQEAWLMENLVLPELPQMVVLRGKDSATREITTHFIAEIDGLYQSFFQTFDTHDGPNYATREIYFPIGFGSPRLLYIKNGDVTHIFDPQAGRLDTFDIETLRPIMREYDALDVELIVVVDEEGEYQLDEKANFKYDSRGNKLRTIKKRKVELLQWDGKQLMAITD